MLALLISGVLGYVLWTLKDLPDPGQAVASSRSIIIYDRKGREIQQISAEGAYHHDVTLAEMGKLGPLAGINLPPGIFGGSRG